MIVFNLKEQDDEQKDKELVSDFCSFIIGKETSFKCTRLGVKSQHQLDLLKLNSQIP